ncbi:hypothetical protein ACO2Q3_13115 [Caulobacter sp. KR2-114]|uniref:hypothetical protein n=1 Tax=Caulobacter sp. KR2-114 TaxID=3400912 RepID=UPI003C019D3D
MLQSKLRALGALAGVAALAGAGAATAAGPATTAPAAAPSPPAATGLCILSFDATAGRTAEAREAAWRRGVYGQLLAATRPVYAQAGCKALVSKGDVLMAGAAPDLTNDVLRAMIAAPPPTPPSGLAPGAKAPGFRELFADLNPPKPGDPLLAGACGVSAPDIMRQSRTMKYIDDRIAELKAGADAEVDAANAPLKVEADALLDGQGKLSDADYAARLAALRDHSRAQRTLMATRKAQLVQAEGKALAPFQAQLIGDLQTLVAQRHCAMLLDTHALGPFPPERELTADTVTQLNAAFAPFPITLEPLPAK